MIELAVDAGAQLGECPVWNPTEGVLYWIDIDGRAVHRFDPSSGLDEWVATGGRPGSVALTETPRRLLLAMEHQVGWFEWGGGFDPWVDLEAADTGNRLNDGRCDPAGRFWVGSMFERAADNRFTGMLHRLDPSGSTVTVRREVGVSNALAFSLDGRTMYWADTLLDRIWAYDYDPDSGTPTGERVFVDFTDQPGRPDGACVDADGCVWVACVHGWAVARFTPQGDRERLIELPVENPTMPAFGGTRLDTLFVTSIGDGGSHEAGPDQTAPGGLFAVDVGVEGVVEPRFGG